MFLSKVVKTYTIELDYGMIAASKTIILWMIM